MSDEELDHERVHETPAVNVGGTTLPAQVFGALAHQRRRYSLYYLRDHGQAQTDDLAIPSMKNRP